MDAAMSRPSRLATSPTTRPPRARLPRASFPPGVASASTPRTAASQAEQIVVGRRLTKPLQASRHSASGGALRAEWLGWLADRRVPRCDSTGRVITPNVTLLTQANEYVILARHIV